ncbi:MAG: hypothetical protein FWG15_06890 [Propionibacteriaceae bacterium]|jgi:hypothetical protein|nr:hypothetical protein [Propionibacteriaceae bacterium]
MTSITGLRGTAGEGWITWPVGSPSSVITELTAVMEDDPEGVTSLTTLIDECDKAGEGRGALLAGLWVPGQVLAQMWIGVIVEPTDEIYRSARRYERIVTGRTDEGDATIYRQSVSSLFAGDTEAIMTVENRAHGDEGEGYTLARIVYFPLSTKDRVIIEAVTPEFVVFDELEENVTQMASHLIIESTEIEKD